MRIIFMGSPYFAVPSLEKLHQSKHDIVAVVSGVDKRRGRGNKLTPTPVKAKALELGLPVIEIENLKSEDFAEQLKTYNPELFVVVAFRILPINILAIPTRGSINLHASLLPKYRGAAPIHWAIIKGEKKTGCTIFFLDEKMDTGKIIMQEEVDIGQNETTGDVYNKLMDLGSQLVAKAVDQISNGSYQTVEQDDSKATGAPKLFSEDCKIDFNDTSQNVHNKIRGLSPFPTAWTTIDGTRFKIYRSRAVPGKSIPAGTLKIENDHVYVGCKDGAVELVEVQLSGKKKMNANDFFLGYKGEGKIA
ncbi:MAG TPA: methionyl-tRNA formyltransferase [Balneolales bacterium]|nr:methionyl-tRNA formyltransferase [Balneolales bacterium]